MTTKRRPLNRSQGPAITAEMVELFKRGCELQAAGHGDIDDKSPEHDEFIQIAKRLEWMLLQLPAHACSVFDPALDRKQPPSYFRPEHAMLRDCQVSQRLRKGAARRAVQQCKGSFTLV